MKSESSIHFTDEELYKATKKACLGRINLFLFCIRNGIFFPAVSVFSNNAVDCSNLTTSLFFTYSYGMANDFVPFSF